MHYFTKEHFDYLSEVTTWKHDEERKIKIQGLFTATLQNQFVFDQIQHDYLIPVILKIRLNKVLLAGQNCTAMYWKKKFVSSKACSVAFYQPEMIVNQIHWNEHEKIHTIEI